MKKLFSALMVVAITAATSNAALLDFNGCVTWSSDGAFAQDAPFSGQIAFDLATPDSNPANANVGVYSNAMSAFTVTVGSYSASGAMGANTITSANVAANDILAFADDAAGSAVVAGGPALTDMDLVFTDGSATAVSTDSLADAIAAVNSNSYSMMELTLQFANGSTLKGLVKGATATLAAVPEPSAFALLGLTFSGIGFLNWKRRRQGELEETAEV